MQQWEHRFVPPPEAVAPVDRRSAEMGAVVRLLEGHELVAVLLPLHLPVLPRQAQGRFDAVRSSGGEEGPPHPFRRKQLCEPFGQLDHPWSGRALERRVVGEFRQLLGNRPLDRLTGVAEVDVPQAPHGINDAVALLILDEHPLALADDTRRVGLDFRRMPHRVEDVAGVVIGQELGVTHGVVRGLLWLI